VIRYIEPHTFKDLPNSDSRNKGAEKGKDDDGSEISEKVFLVAYMNRKIGLIIGVLTCFSS